MLRDTRIGNELAMPAPNAFYPAGGITVGYAAAGIHTGAVTVSDGLLVTCLLFMRVSVHSACC